MTAFRLGLTGSIGMGKSTTAGFFAEAGVPVWDADAAVHRLYTAGGSAVAPLASLYPDALFDGAIDRAVLKSWIATDTTALRRIEAVVHPLVAADRAAFQTAASTDIIVFDIPLLFEKRTEADMDATLVVTAPPALQRARVMARPGMTEEKFAAILALQLPDADKRARADYVIDTGTSLEETRAAVSQLVNSIAPQLPD